ncbi:MAG: alpha/beta hydrolase [Deinococcus-Thermus bacterium]|nr:MAG: alpha/beta hydrolase [Deinococcota bacterium]
MFEGFQRLDVQTSEVRIHLVKGGQGPPLLLLHGYPQTHAMWHKVAPALAQHFTVVAPDLRGYGDSGKPPGDPQHQNYSKRRMAQDQLEVMRALGFERFLVVGHDRGGRVGHRMALDYPERVLKLVVLDIVPTPYVFAHLSRELAVAYYHWFFLAQPRGFPERLIGFDPIGFLHQKLGGWGTGLGVFDPRALAEYERCFRDPATIHATCEDYRAAASIDLEHHAADTEKLRCPLLVLWGSKGVVHRTCDPLAAWRAYAQDVRGEAIEAGHFLCEENPTETLRALLAFLL